MKNSEKSKLGKETIVRRVVFKNVYTPIFNSLKKIEKSSIDALEVLVENNFSFISDKGLEVLEKFRKSKENIVCYYNPRTKEVSTEKIESTIKEKDIKAMIVIDVEENIDNIDMDSVEDLKVLKELYEEDIYFEEKVEREFVYEKFVENQYN